MLVSFPVGFVPTWLITVATLLSCGLDKCSSSTSDFCELAGSAPWKDGSTPLFASHPSALSLQVSCYIVRTQLFLSGWQSIFVAIPCHTVTKYQYEGYNSWLLVVYWLKYIEQSTLWLNNQSGLIYLCECLQCGNWLSFYNTAMVCIKLKRWRHKQSIKDE